MHPEIVYVEDNPAEVFLLFEAFRTMDPDLRLTTVPDGEAALGFLDSATGKPCVVVIDLGLPKIGGIEVFRALKAHAKFEKVPVVIFADEPFRKQVLDTGHAPDLFLIKPMDLKGYDAVAELIVQLCRNKHGDQSQSVSV
jgi:CheY-like chemotaxis protein